jgi:hypothetical protein
MIILMPVLQHSGTWVLVKPRVIQNREGKKERKKEMKTSGRDLKFLHTAN